MADVEPLVDAQARLGECVLWCDRTQSVWWTDIEGRRLGRQDWHGGVRREWALPDRVGSFALCERPGWLLLGLAKGVALFDSASGTLGPVVPVEADQPATRINDGRCDRQGRFVFGTFHEARGGGPTGGFYRVGPDLAVERLPLAAVTVANGIAFSPDGSRMYFADSPTGTIQCVAYGADGSLGRPRTFARFAAGDGYPDGACVDAEGGLWSAHWDGGCVVRYAPDGAESARIRLPVTRPTCPALAGPDLDRLLVATARIGLREPAAQPLAGAILAIRTHARGLPEPRFRAAP